MKFGRWYFFQFFSLAVYIFFLYLPVKRFGCVLHNNESLRKYNAPNVED